jgi:signal transduction histidine kinase
MVRSLTPADLLTPPRRSARGPVILMAAVAVGLGAAMQWRGPSFGEAPLSWITASFNLISAWIVWRRSAEGGPEARGWRLITGTLVIGFAVNALSATSEGSVLGPSIGPFIFAIAVPGQVLLVVGLLLWPWRRHGTSRPLLHALGSALFIGSLLLFLWLVGTWAASAGAVGLDHEVMLYTALRFCFVGGVSLYLLTESPSRIRGALGWVLLTLLFAGVYIAALQLIVQGVVALSPLTAVSAVGPLCFAIAAWTRAPVEPKVDGEARREWDLLPYIPFVVAAVAIVVEPSTGGTPRGLVIAFMGLTALLVLRQFVLLGELRVANERLEERVADRTRALQNLQAVVLRTERMNTLATLGAGLTHDLNNLLCAIQTNAELIRLELSRGRTPSDRALTSIMDASDRANSLTRRVMSFARRESTPTAPAPASEVLSSLEPVLRLLLRRVDKLALDLGPELDGLWVDRAGLEQVLVNLVSNARDAMPGGGVVRVSARKDQRADGRLAVALEVRDEGVGMTDDILERLFEPFFTTKDSGKGTGLGLASVRLLLQEIGGSVSVTSKPGAGSTFSVLFPTAEVVAQASAQRATSGA